MKTIGIDIGSTYTKYCVMDGSEIISLSSERTPIRQKEYFEKKTEELEADTGRTTREQVIRSLNLSRWRQERGRWLRITMSCSTSVDRIQR